MLPLPFPIKLDSGNNSPIFVQISKAIAADIARGRLKPGVALPGTRSLAVALGVHRSTVVAAYAELLAQGWIGTRQGGTTYVATESPEPTPRRLTKRGKGSRVVGAQLGFAVEASAIHVKPLPPASVRDPIFMWGGVPDLRLVPVELLARAYRRVARRHGHTLLGYYLDGRGHPRLRSALGQFLSSTRGIAVGEDNLIVTRGSQMALDLVARSLLRPGDAVVVESPGYSSAFNVFRRAGAEVIPIAVDAHGLDVAALERVSQRRKIRLIYVTPHHQYPTTVVLSPGRRLALLDLARQKQIAILEDDYDQEFHYDGRPVLPLASHDEHGNVIYVGTLAKILAPGLRLGFVVAPSPLVARMADERVLIDRQGDAVLECAVAELLEDGDIQRHVRRTRRIYEERRDALCQSVDTRFSGVLSYSRPAGGLSLWARVAPAVDVAHWEAQSRKRGVHFQTGQQFTYDGQAIPFVRLGFSSLDPKSLELATRRMLDALRAVKRKSNNG